ncbi:MAG: hypothetical protein A2Y14_05815 [Verrucomicrobia bacterium GWF2_51_19]|nr:MAG: hypothetical protein A2Y14_05815 [Verrucomicrobia bacterium GWF2_51_19]HCJ12166.1 hypothetical protein [Opitutae bacterium]
MKFIDLNNKYAGKRAFIVATGPSLRIHDLDFLVDEVTLSCNKIFLAFDQTPWRPTFYSIADRLVAEELRHEVGAIPSIKIFTSVARPFVNAPDILWLNDLPSPLIDGEPQIQFSSDINDGIHGGYTVVYTLMQIAYYIGIRELYLIGLDFAFSLSKDTGQKTEYGETILQQSKEGNHFHPRYRTENSRWTAPRLDRQYEAFKLAKHVFEDDGRSIFNASRKTALDVFHRVSFDELFN